MISTRTSKYFTALLVTAWLGGCETGSEGSSATQSTPAATATTAGTLVLATAATDPAAGATSVTITVNRANGSSGAVAVSYSTANGSAVSGSNYTAASGTLQWAAGDATAKTIQITLSNASSFSGAKTFTLALASPTGGAALGSPAKATVSINGTQAAPQAVDSGVPMGQTAAARLLMQGTFGATLTTLQATSTQSYDAWFAAQASAAPGLYASKYTAAMGDWSPIWWDNVILGNDQLRQRMAFALSEILVISQAAGAIWGHNVGLVNYYDILVNNALGNYRTLLEQVTLAPAMGEFLSNDRNNKPNLATGVHADQNFAREVMQLFTVGLVKLNVDGTPMLGTDGNPIPTYVQADVENMANALTGWSFKSIDTSENGWLYAFNETEPMAAYPLHHDTDAKTIIGGVVIPAGGTAASDLKIALDTLFNHPNAGPFLSRQLIQRLVTSNPSPAYVGRVAAVFNNDGTGVRGNLLALAKAILTDPEAVTPGDNTYGKVREPMLRVTNLWRAFSGLNSQGHATEFGIIDRAMDKFGEYPLYSPTVFNFFRPDFQPSGALTSANMVAPEIQITNEASLVTTANALQWVAYQYVDAAGNSHAGPNYNLPVTPEMVALHTAAWEPLAANAGNLVDQMGLVLMAGQMPAAMRSTLVGYVTGAASTTPTPTPGSTVAEVAELIINSPQYAVQR
jgi:uncharacterized protein (DUF1800 family)